MVAECGHGRGTVTVREFRLELDLEAFREVASCGVRSTKLLRRREGLVIPPLLYLSWVAGLGLYWVHFGPKVVHLGHCKNSVW